MNLFRPRPFLLFIVSTLAAVAQAQGLPEKAQAKIDRWIAEAHELAAQPDVVNAVAAQNAQMPAEIAATTEEKWTALADMDPFVRQFTKNAAAIALKAKKNEARTEAFLSDRNGLKVAFLAKTTAWSHKDKPKHEVPMTGKAWQGKLELDKSTHTRQIQVSVPVMQDGKAIGSLVQGFSMSDLSD